MAEISFIRHVLRLLTLDEVEELTTVTEVEDMHSLTDLAKEYLCSFYMAPVVAEGELAAATGEQDSASSAVNRETVPKTVAEFIFQEKEKFKKFNQQSKKQKSMEIYRHTLAHGHRRTSSAANQETSATVGTGKGTLINRRVG